jgi:hypothetical protein
MSLLLTIFGFSVACVGLIGILKPRRLRELVSAGEIHSRFHSAIMMRILVGGLMLAAAPGCKFPLVITFLGVGALVAAVALYVLGERKFEAFADWWSNRPMASLRAVSVLALALGLFLFYAPA